MPFWWEYNAELIALDMFSKLLNPNKIWTDQVSHQDHLPNIVLVFLLLPKQSWPVKAPLDIWSCAVVPSIKMLATDALVFSI